MHHISFGTKVFVVFLSLIFGGACSLARTLMYTHIRIYNSEYNAPRVLSARARPTKASRRAQNRNMGCTTMDVRDPFGEIEAPQTSHLGF